MIPKCNRGLLLYLHKTKGDPKQEEEQREGSRLDDMNVIAAALDIVHDGMNNDAVLRMNNEQISANWNVSYR